MLGCTETITIVRMVYHAALDRDEYTSHIIHGVSWFGKLVVGLEGKGLTGKSEYHVRIPSTVTLPVEIGVGDTIIHGAVGKIEGAADFQELPHFTVLSVGDNRRGGRPHWAVRGS